MLDFTFVSPTKIYFGKNRENEIGQILKAYGYHKILLHYGQGSIFKTGLYTKIINSLKENDIAYVELGNVEPNPNIDLVRKGIKIVKKHQIELILAVGGGSVIDSSKAIACGVGSNMDPWLFVTCQKVPTSSLPIGVILTISAAGSELSNSCVISDKAKHIKNGFNTDLIRPLFAIMNPELTFSVSPYQTACGIVDILMHTLERYFSDVDDLLFTDEIALGLIKAVIKAGKRVIEDPNDYSARATLMIASSFSHNGLTGLGSNMYFTVHKLEHVLSGLYDNVSHGAGLAILFPAWAKYTKKLFEKKWQYLVKVVLDATPSNATDEGISFFENYFKFLKMPTTLKEIGITSDRFVNFAMCATQNQTKKVIGVMPLAYDDVINILTLAA